MNADLSNGDSFLDLSAAISQFAQVGKEDQMLRAFTMILDRQLFIGGALFKSGWIFTDQSEKNPPSTFPLRNHSITRKDLRNLRKQKMGYKYTDQNTTHNKQKDKKPLFLLILIYSYER